MAKRQLPSPEELRQLLRYEPETGKLFWRERGPEWFKNEGDMRRWNGRFAGRETFLVRLQNGYLQGTVLRAQLLAHRVAWAIHFGRWPDDEIDHIDRDSAANRISNLREATRRENSINRGMHKNNTSGHKGVYWYAKANRWVATIKLATGRKHLGNFVQKEDAVAARLAAEMRYEPMLHKNALPS